MSGPIKNTDPDTILSAVVEERGKVGQALHDRLASSLYSTAADIAGRTVQAGASSAARRDIAIDRILTSSIYGFPLMGLGLIAILWMTIRGANYPSAILFDALFWVHDRLEELFQFCGAPWWLTGFVVNGVYRGLAWVVAVMLPPMAIFFPIFTFLEDIGYLPRIAFNLDRVFRWAGAHGKQALTMGMGFGCNAAGVVACRIIDSPRERLIAILTNNFMLCNGRWPTIIMLSSIFVAAAFPPMWAGVVATASVATVTMLGVLVTFLVSRVLSKTVLKGEPSHFILELPPFRKPNLLRIIYRSIMDRTIFVLGRACITAAPAGGLIWLLGNISIHGQTLAQVLIDFLNPAGHLLGLDGVILLAYIIAIPANEIVVPTMIMAYSSGSQISDIANLTELSALLRANGWSLNTALCMMLFSLLHYPCATTSWTIYRETGSWRWTIFANMLTLGIAVIACLVVNGVGRLVVS